jgi:hypothetical protein
LTHRGSKERQGCCGKDRIQKSGEMTRRGAYSRAVGHPGRLALVGCGFSDGHIGAKALGEDDFVTANVHFLSLVYPMVLLLGTGAKTSLRMVNHLHFNPLISKLANYDLLLKNEDHDRGYLLINTAP